MCRDIYFFNFRFRFVCFFFLCLYALLFVCSFDRKAQSSASLSFLGPGGLTGAAQSMSTANFYPASPDAMMQSAMLHSIPIYNMQGKIFNYKTNSC